MTTLTAFCARTGIDVAPAREALNARGPYDDAPWYMQAVLGIGAWVTAVVALAFAWVVMDMAFDVDEPNLVVAIAGAIVFAVSVRLLHHRPEGAFTAHAAVALATAGTLMVAAGVGVPAESVWAAVIATVPFAAAAVWQQRSLLLQFLVVSVTLILLFVAIWDHWGQMTADLPAVFVPFGVALLLYPPMRDVRPTALALLVVPQLIEILVFNFDTGWKLWFGWPAKGLLLFVFAFLVFINWRRVGDSQAQLLAAVAALAAAIVAFLLPTGASAALVLLALAYTIGSRSLAIIGALAEIYFIWLFYWDLQETLLTKSVILMSAGAILLACYGLLIGAMRERRPS
ncbi:DUF4401 domain-containing protein [Dongia deserti]|uniref:DUF4401 domain-containing protein n=1 Tax=Dongia deserti TaxID=2268030 RepID=UPI000E6576AB|nr:DUF4401 domain-containing protein [Dongia deserti]